MLKRVLILSSLIFNQVLSQDMKLVDFLSNCKTDTIVKRRESNVLDLGFNRIILSKKVKFDSFDINKYKIDTVPVFFETIYEKIKDSVFFKAINNNNFIKYKYVNNLKNDSFFIIGNDTLNGNYYKRHEIILYKNDTIIKSDYSSIKSNKMNETEVVEYVTLFEKGKKVYFEKRKNNKIVKKYFLANEQIVGYAFYYDEFTGEINIILNYENGKIKDGIYNYYHQGQILRKEEFKDGVLVKKYWNDEFKDFDIYEQELLKQP